MTRRDLALYSVAVLALSWLRFFPSRDSPLVYLIAGLASFGPLLVAIALSAARSGQPGVRSLLGQGLLWRVAPSRYAGALLGPSAITALTLAVLVLTSDQQPLRAQPNWVNVPVIFLAAFVFSAGEEFGWRGYLLPALQRRMPPVVAALLVGAVWGVWHAPLLLGPDVVPPAIGAVPFFLFILGASLLFAWLYNLSGGSVLLVMLMHASVNASVGWTIQERSPGIDPTLLVSAYALATWAVVALLLLTSRARGLRLRETCLPE